MPDELWTEVHDIVQETGIKTTPKKKKYRKAKWLSEEALQIAAKRSSKMRRIKGKIYLSLGCLLCQKNTPELEHPGLESSSFHYHRLCTKNELRRKPM